MKKGERKEERKEERIIMRKVKLMVGWGTIHKFEWEW